MDPIILASSSPRRQEILKLLNIPFVVNPPDIDESFTDSIEIKKIPEYLACQKVNAVVRKISATQETVGWVLGADTAIHYKGKREVSGKGNSKSFRQLQYRILHSLRLGSWRLLNPVKNDPDRILEEDGEAHYSKCRALQEKKDSGRCTKEGNTGLVQL